MTPKKIALLTYKNRPSLPPGENLLLPAFSSAGIRAEETPWDGDVQWNQYANIIIRSSWNYHLKVDSFVNWLQQRVGEGIPIWNRQETVMWNIDKRYLFDLERKRVKILPSILLESEATIDLQETIEEKNWNEVIIKPTFGATAYKLQKFSTNNIQSIQKHIRKNNTIQSWIIQEFRPDVCTEGEHSMVFFNKKYSHAVLKMPKRGDFRSQSDYGGSTIPIQPKSHIIHQAKRILNVIKEPLLYARVDGIVRDDVFYLMELELTEPELYFDYYPDAAKRFVEAYITLS